MSQATTLFKMPKTGSSSIEHLLEDQPDVQIILHDQLDRARAKLRQADWAFTFVRNPFWRLVSAYNWVMHTERKVDQVHENIYQQLSVYADFAETVQHLTEICASKDAIHFLPMHWWICDYPSGKPQAGPLLVDQVYHYESAETDLADLFAQRGLTDVPMDRRSRQIFRSRVPRSRYPDYYHLDSTVEAVLAFYAADFELFGYPGQLPDTE